MKRPTARSSRLRRRAATQAVCSPSRLLRDRSCRSAQSKVLVRFACSLYVQPRRQRAAFGSFDRTPRGVVWNRRAQFWEIPRHLAVCTQRSAALLATARRIQNGSGQPAGSDNDAICVINALGPTTQRQFSGKDGRRRWRGVQQYSPRSAPCRWSQT